MSVSSFQRILHQYGRLVTLRHDDTSRAVRALIQRSKQQSGAPPVSSVNFGDIDSRRWIYIGPSDCALSCGDIMECDGIQYEVQDCEAIYLGRERCYWRAMLRTAKEWYP